MIRAVAFDLDGTLIDSTEAIVASFFHTFDVLNLPRPSRQQVVSTIGYLLEEQFAQVTDHDPDECVQIYRAHYVQIACDATVPLPGAKPCTEQLREAGLRLAFATSKKRTYAEMILAHLDLLDPFECRVGPEDVTNGKPHPEPILKVLEGLDVAADELIYVGDTAFDVGAARDAGVQCVCVTTGYNTRQELEALNPDAVFDTLAEATRYILRGLGSG
jgi:2-phosphoglycolate phosphatase